MIRDPYATPGMDWLAHQMTCHYGPDCPGRGCDEGVRLFAEFGVWEAAMATEVGR